MPRLYPLAATPPRLLEVTRNGLEPIALARLDRERRLEDWLSRDLTPLGLDAMAIGRQVETPHGGRIDLLAIDRDGDLLVVEIKRDRSPRDCIAQVLDYASWVRLLDAAEVEDIYRLLHGRDLAEDFHQRFGAPLPAEINGRHRLVVLANEVDDATRRIAAYLAEHGRLNVNLATFHLYRFGERELVAIDWLVDPSAEPARGDSGESGIWFVNVGADPNADWEDNRRFGYVGARGGAAHGRRLGHLKPGDWFFAYRRGEGDLRGYVGFGEVLAAAAAAGRAEIGGRAFLSLAIDTRRFRPADGGEPPVVLPVRWIKTVAETEARRFRGAFANQNVVCRLTDVATLDFLKREFGG